jgi:hypothetical protein
MVPSPIFSRTTAIIFDKSRVGTPTIQVGPTRLRNYCIGLQRLGLGGNSSIHFGFGRKWIRKDRNGQNMYKSSCEHSIWTAKSRDGFGRRHPTRRTESIG